MNKKNMFKSLLLMCLLALPLNTLADNYKRGDCDHGCEGFSVHGEKKVVHHHCMRCGR